MAVLGAASRRSTPLARIRRRRSSAQIVSIKPPKGTGAIYRLNGEGSRGPLDLLVLAEAKGGLGYFHQRILPGLTFTAKPKTVRRGKKVTFRVRGRRDSR